MKPTAKQVRFVLKPALFVAALLPLAWMLLRVFEFAGPGLGANPIEAIQDFFGIWALRFLLITLTMSPLRMLIKQPWPLAFRRMLGLYAFFYCALHFLTWLILDQSLNADAIVEDIIKRPFITIGVIALMLLIPLAVTSTSNWQRRLGKNWKKLHRLTYAISILAVWHYYWQVKLDTIDALVYAVILTALLGLRLLNRKAAGKKTK